MTKCSYLTDIIKHGVFLHMEDEIQRENRIT